MRSSKRARPVEAARKEGCPPDLPYGQHQIVVPAKPWLYLERHTGRKVKLYWMKTSEAWPDDIWLESQLTCFDENKPDRASDSPWDTYIGNVSQIEGGPRGGLWRWSVTARFPGPRYPGPTSGKEISRKDAGRCVHECYERMLRFYGKRRPGT